jgi:hypothetical protein
VTFRIVPVTFAQANSFVAMFHRHNQKVLSAKLYIGLMHDDELIGVAIAGRPVARMLDDGATLEITRVCVKDGYPNANSMLYGRIKKIAMLMGYKRVVTYTLKKEAQSSLLAIGAVPHEASKPRQWTTPSRQRYQSQIYNEPKLRWELLP